MHVCEAQREECVCAGGEGIMSGSAVGGLPASRGGGEVDFFSHPFFMAFLLSDLQSLYIRLTGRFSFIFKHLLGTQCVCLVVFGRGFRWQLGSRLRHAVFHQAIMTVSPHWIPR